MRSKIDRIFYFPMTILISSSAWPLPLWRPGGVFSDLGSIRFWLAAAAIALTVFGLLKRRNAKGDYTPADIATAVFSIAAGIFSAILSRGEDLGEYSIIALITSVAAVALIFIAVNSRNHIYSLLYSSERSWRLKDRDIRWTRNKAKWRKEQKLLELNCFISAFLISLSCRVIPDGVATYVICFANLLLSLTSYNSYNLYLLGPDDLPGEI